ncbi:MAG: PilZ domain-containing protein [Nitrospirae bacterium]|nr:PilZ domain-containing protein [Nitrospirota bacterium]
MSKLIGFLDDTTKGHWAHIRMDNGDPCWIIISRTGVSVKKSRVGLFGSKLYEEKNIYKAAKTAKTLSLLYTDNLIPAEMQNSVLKSFTNAVLHSHSLTEVIALLNEVSGYLQGRAGEVSFVRNLLGLSDKLRAENGLKATDDVQEAAVSVAAHMVTRSLLETGRSPMKSSVDSAGSVTSAMLLCFVSSSLIMRLRQEGFALSVTDITRKSGLAIFHLYEEDEAAGVISEGTRQYEALIAFRDELQDIREFSDSVNQLVYTYVVSGNKKYICILGKLYTAFLDAHAYLIQKQAERPAKNSGKRRYKRFAVENMDVHAKTLFAAEIDLLNISMSGACILSKKSLKAGDKYLIKLAMHLSLPCVVIWESLCRSLKKSGGEFIPAYRTGVAFKDMTSDKLVKLKDFIRVSGIPNEQRLSDEYRPSALRFTVFTNGKAALLYPKTSPVKKMSLGGMLVELHNGVQAEKKFPMALILPNEALPVRFQGRVASCIAIPNERSKRFDIGIEFLDMAEYDRSRVSKFLGLLESSQRIEKSEEFF